MEDIKTLDQTYVAHSYGRYPVTLVRGRGAEAWDDAGKRYIDLGSGIAVNTFGFADADWIQAVTAQLQELQHTSNLYYTGPCAKLARQLCKRTGLKRVFFGNSGAEANEGLIKAARRWAFLKYGDESHSTIVTLVNSFHGRTITTLSATGQEAFHREFGPFTPGFVHAPVGDAARLRELTEERGCCAVLIELVQGEGGVMALPRDYVEAIAALCKEKELLLLVDEVQTGNGRTGSLYAFQQYGISPDGVSTAKGLAGGLPLGAVMLGERLQDIFVPGSHGSTFGGNPVACAGALCNLERLDEACLAGVRERSGWLRAELTGAPGVKAVTGLGLMVGLETEKAAGDVVLACLNRGVLVLTAHDRVRLLPPLNIPMPMLQEAVKILKEVLAP